MKRCSKCGVEKPAEEFSPAKRTRDRRHSQCHACAAAAERQRRIAKGDSIRATQREKRRASPELAIFKDMVRRCADPRRKDYKHYGGRGISVAPEWLAVGGADRFVEHVGPRPSPHHSIDRIKNDRGYEPGNVRWATQQEQTRNFSRNHLITVDGRTQCLSAWAVEKGVSPVLICQRILRLGWADHDAVMTPPRVAAPKRSGLVVNGEHRSFAAWSRLYGISEASIRHRIGAGWEAERAVKTPARRAVAP